MNASSAGIHDGSRYDVFISYSHAASGEVARGLQGWLQRYANPWWRRRALTVFRDETDLAASPEAWSSIVSALDCSEWLVLIASPEAARSKWVKRELHHWLGGSADLPLNQLDDAVTRVNPCRRARLLLVIVEGKVTWLDGKAPGTGDFDWSATDAVPRCLSGVFDGEPLWVDLRRVTAETAGRRTLNRSNPEFIGAVAQLSSAIRGIRLSDLVGEDIRLYRRALRTAWSAALTLAFLTLVALLGFGAAVVAARTAEWERRIAAVERNAAEARSLAVLQPAALAKAGEKARQAYLEMLSLAGQAPGPRWIHALLGGSTTYVLTPETLGAADEVMRVADDLTPGLIGAVAPKDVSVVSDAVVLADGTSVMFYGGASTISTWRPGERPTQQPFDPPLTRVNGRANLAFSGDGAVAASEAGDNQVRVLDVRTGLVRHLIDPATLFPASAFEALPSGPPRPGAAMTETFRAGLGSRATPRLAGLALDQRGDRLLIVARGGVARLLAVDPGAPPRPLGDPWPVTFPDHFDPMRMAQWLLDARGEILAATPSSIEIGRAPVGLWRASNGAAMQPSLVVEDQVTALTFSPDAARLGAGLQNGTIVVWDVATGTRERSLDMGTPVRSLAYGSSAAEGLLLAGGDGFARVFDVSTRREVARAPHTGRLDVVAWSEDGRHFATGSVFAREHPALRLWDLDAALRTAPTRMRSRYGVERLRYAQGTLAALAWPSTIHAWDAATGVPRQRFADKGIIRSALGFKSAGAELATLVPEADGLAAFFALANGERRLVPGPGLTTVAYTDRRPYVSFAAFDSSGERLLRLVRRPDDHPCELELFELGTVEPQWTAPCDPATEAIALSPDGRIAATLTTGDSASVTLDRIDARSTWRIPVVAPKRLGVGDQLAFSSDGRRIAAALGSTAVVLDVATGAPIGPALEVEGTASLVTLDATGARMVVALQSGRVIVARVESGERMAIHPVPPFGGIGGLQIADDTNMIWAAFGDASANNPRVWRWRLTLDQVADSLARRLPPILELQD